jgi:hypothetical protein
MDAEQCALQEIEAQVGQDDLIAFDEPDQYLSEESILQMALENGMLATQNNSNAALDDVQAQHIVAETEAQRLLDNIRNTTGQNFFIESQTLH